MQRYEHKGNQNVYICYFYIKKNQTCKNLFHYSKLCHLNSNDGTSILAFGAGSSLRINEGPTLEKKINAFIKEHDGSYVFSLLSYDIKNEIEKLNSNNSDDVCFPIALLWRPEIVVSIKQSTIKYLQGKESPNHQFLFEYFKHNAVVPEINETVKFQAKHLKKATYQP